MPRVSFVFADGEEVSCNASTDETILAAAQAAGIPLASDCHVGDCQTCRAHLKSGKIEIDEIAFITLDDEEIEGGAILTCISMAKEDLKIELSYLRGHILPEKRYLMKIRDVVQLSATTARLRGQLPNGSVFRFFPGQYANIKIPGSGVLRSYSMANDPAEPNSLEFHIRMLPDGQMSNFIGKPDLAGTSLELLGPKGVFYLREGNSPIVMIAGGTGLAPMVSMLRSIVQGRQIERSIVLCFGVNRPGDLYYVEELEELKGSLPNLEVRLSMTEADGAWSGHKGLVTELVGPNDIGEPTQIYLCGPPLMIAAARKRVAACGGRRNSVYAEEFLATG